MPNMGDYSLEESIFGFSGPAARIAAAAILLVAISVVLYSLPEKSSEWIGSREIIRKLYLLPILLSSMWFGASGAASSTAFATLVCGGLAGNEWPAEVSSQIGRVGEVAVFWLVGGLSASFLEQQKRFVGKIGIPDKVLLKPGPLSEEEWAVMRNHPEVGAGMLRKIEFLRDIAKKNETPLLFASPPVPSLYQVTSALFPRS